MNYKAYILIALLSLTLPTVSLGQSYEQTLNFCRISQMLIPVFLRDGNISGESVCDFGGGASYQCTSLMSLGEGICVAGGGASYQCTSSMSLGAGVCVAGGGASYQSTNSISYAQGVCIAGGGASYQCSSSMSLGEAVCIAGGRGSYQCSGIGNQDLGEGICMALGGSQYQCNNVSVSDAVCAFTNNCRGRNAAAIAISMVEACGPAVLHFGIKQ